MSLNSYDRKRAGALLQSKRMEAGFTQEKLAEVIGCSSGTIASIEGGTVGMSTEMLLTLCRLLKATPNEVLLENTFEESAWLNDRLSVLTPEQRAVALRILTPYIESVTQSEGK